MISYNWVSGNQFSYKDKIISSRTLWNTSDILFESDSEKVRYIQKSKYYYKYHKTEDLCWDKFFTVSLLVLSLSEVREPDFIITKNNRCFAIVFDMNYCPCSIIFDSKHKKYYLNIDTIQMAFKDLKYIWKILKF